MLNVNEKKIIVKIKEGAIFKNDKEFWAYGGYYVSTNGASFPMIISEKVNFTDGGQMKTILTMGNGRMTDVSITTLTLLTRPGKAYNIIE